MENIVLFTPFFALLLDFLLGEPPQKIHPVCAVGKTAFFLEQKFLNSAKSSAAKFFGGLFCSLTVTVIFAVIPLLVFLLIKKYFFSHEENGYFLFSFLFSGIILYLCIAPKSLVYHVNAVKQELEKHDLTAARGKLSRIVGRNTEKLNEAGIVRASIESLSENSVDSTAASFFWFTAGFVLLSFEGAVFLTVFHRIFNTLDAMWGKRNEKYLYFGKFAARTDDVLNFFPSRLTFYIIVLSCLFIKNCSAKTAYTIGRKYRSRHASPNSGWAEAPYAGALNLKLAGPVYYGDFFCDYPYIGEGTADADLSHLETAITIFYSTVFLTVIFCTVILFLACLK